MLIKTIIAALALSFSLSADSIIPAATLDLQVNPGSFSGCVLPAICYPSDRTSQGLYSGLPGGFLSASSGNTTATAGALEIPQPSVSVMTVSDFLAFAGARLTYSTVATQIGGQPGELAHVILSGNISVAETGGYDGDNNAFASFDGLLVSCSTVELDQLSKDFVGQCTFSAPATFVPGTVYPILIGVSTSGGCVNIPCSPVPAKDSVMLDPVLQLDPAFANSADFSLAFSPGIGNAPESSVPEPSSLSSLAIGILGLVVVRRKLGGLVTRQRG